MTAQSSVYDEHLGRNAANFQQLTPLTYLDRSARVFPERTAIVHGDLRLSWAEVYTRCRRFASALAKRGIGKNETVAILAPNTPAHFEAHFAVPMAGAVLNSINIRLDAPIVAFILEHGAARMLFVDHEFSALAHDAVQRLEEPPEIVLIEDPLCKGDASPDFAATEYEAFLAEGDPDFTWEPPADEWDAITLNYTSGTTGNPKGVVYHHRGAYLMSLSNMVVGNMTEAPVYLWTLPMFHCNGWCFPWTVAAAAGTNICLRRVEAAPVFDALAQHKVTHFCGAPIVMNMINNAPEAAKKPLPHTVNVMTAGAPPPAAVIQGMESHGFRVIHLYGLTETYGPATISEWQEQWDDLDASERARLKSRQGVRYPSLEGLMVADPETLEPVPADGETMGEVMFRGNIVMKGYLKNPKATDEAFRGGWFHSGDLGVLHPDGYIELRDRSKDIIISGGENISSIEVEGILYRHPAVLEAAIVARPDEKWGETPCAFVTLKDGKTATEEEIIAFCRDNMAHFKVPKTIVFAALPKTSTGKIQKFKLRQQAESL